MAESPTDRQPPSSANDSLTRRELAVVALTVEALSNVEIGQRLGISDRTVQAHLGAARRKTNTRSRTHLAVHALRTGLVPMPVDPIVR